MVHTYLLPHTLIKLSNFSSFNLISIFRCSSSPHNPVYVRSVISSVLASSLSYHRYSYIRLLFNSHFFFFCTFTLPPGMDLNATETDVEKNLQYHTDYNNRPSHDIFFTTVIEYVWVRKPP